MFVRCVRAHYLVRFSISFRTSLHAAPNAAFDQALEASGKIIYDYSMRYN